ncbi:MAG: 4-(cytidine 5'-diphospho)-2-C-methyl-D-erythritol kinase [Clostridia bacterium]|nr:4-(cytidine 5'-diphospho)-2-C-methyl-D-erythritol kinase [Clostridia bacterium]
MTVSEKAYAKINLYLDVLGKRSDGFHDILSVMQSVSLADLVIVSCEDSATTEITISSNSSEIPTDSRNITYRIAEKYLNTFGIASRLHIHIDKHIPVGAGLGGGSSDGAATLRAMYRIFGKGSREQLLDICASVGSDLPFCLLGGMYLCGGRGEKLKRIDCTSVSNFVLAIGNSRISTPTAYAELDRINNNYIEYTPTDEILMYRQIIADTVNYGEDSIPIYNVFEQVTDIDEISKIKEIMKKNGAEITLMSGSGPSVFCFFRDSSEADRICLGLKLGGFDAFECYSVYPEEFI